eukprot:3941591-Rhodomonas_salina.2
MQRARARVRKHAPAPDLPDPLGYRLGLSVARYPPLLHCTGHLRQISGHVSRHALVAPVHVRPQVQQHLSSVGLAFAASVVQCRAPAPSAYVHRCAPRDD